MADRDLESLEQVPLEAFGKIDALCERFEAAWTSGQTPCLQDYLAEAPAGAGSLLLKELLPLDVEYRRGRGETPSLADYAQQIPDHASLLRELWLELGLTEPATGAGGGANEQLPQQFGRYQLFDELARGGMGAVYRAHDTDLGRDLAVKVLLSTYQDNPAVVQRFTEEAQIGGQLQHPGIAPVHEVGRFPDGRPFIAMKLVKGRTLAALLAERTNPRQERARFLGIFELLCQTLAYVHSRRVMHRDLKPANVMVGAFGEVQVMDWGLAKVLPSNRQGLQPPRVASASPVPSGSEPSISRTMRSQDSDRPNSDPLATMDGSVLGTPAYMPPEQALGEVDRLDERCDVFALGAILCEVLTGQPPYLGEDSAHVHRKARRGDLKDAWERLDGCGADAQLADLTKRCLVPELNDRPRDAGVVASEMQAYLTEVQERVYTAELAAVEARARAAQERKARQVTVALSALVLLSVLLGVAGWLWMEHNRQRQIASTNQQAKDALAEVLELRERARSAPADDLTPWTEAHARALRAAAFLESGVVDPLLAGRVEELRQELDDAVKDRQLVARLDDIWLRSVEEGPENEQLAHALAAGYAQAFRVWGLSIGTADAVLAAARIRQRQEPIRGALVAALEDWARVCKPDRANSKHRLLALARAVDPQDWQTRLRLAVAQQDFATAYRLLGQAFAAKGNRGEAIAAYGRVIRPLAKNALAYQHLGEALTNAGFEDEARAAFRQAVQLKPDDTAAHHALASSLSRTGDRDAALAAYRKLLALKEDDPIALDRVSNALIDLEDWSAAADLYGKAVTVNPADHDTWRRCCTLDLQAGDEDAYCRHRHALLARFATTTDPLIAERLAKACLLRPASGADLQQACALAECSGTDAAPQWAMPYARLAKGMAAYRQGRLDSAIDWLHKALIHSSPGWKSPQPQLLLALVWQHRGRPEEARKWLTEAVQMLDRKVTDEAPLTVWECQVLRREAETLIELEPKMEALRKKEVTLHGPGERLALAELCVRNRRYPLAAARLFADAFAADPDLADDRTSGHRYHAACCAALASSGRGEDAGQLADAERGHWREQALAWLRAELVQLSNPLEGARQKEGEAMREALECWQHDSRLTGLREASALTGLSPGEQQACRKLWADVEALIAKSRSSR